MTGGHELECKQLSSRAPEQAGEVAQPLGVLQAESIPLEPDRPVVALSTEDVDSAPFLDGDVIHGRGRPDEAPSASRTLATLRRKARSTKVLGGLRRTRQEFRGCSRSPAASRARSIRAKSYWVYATQGRAPIAAFSSSASPKRAAASSHRRRVEARMPTQREMDPVLTSPPVGKLRAAYGESRSCKVAARRTSPSRS